MQRYRDIVATGFIVVLGLWAGYSQFRADKAAQLSQLSSEAAKLADRDSADTMLTVLSSIRENTVEMSRMQGKIEGMVSVAMNLPVENNLTSGVWHEGYYKGLKQSEDEKQLFYTQGYHKATEDMNCPANCPTRKENAAENAFLSDEAKFKFDGQEARIAYMEAQNRNIIEEATKQNQALQAKIKELYAQLGEKQENEKKIVEQKTNPPKSPESTAQKK
jgi:hypothetical protein